MKSARIIAALIIALVSLTASGRGPFTTGNAFKEIESIPGFQTGTIDRNSDYGYPDEFGFGAYTGYGNSGPRGKVEKIIAKLPREWQLFNQDTDGTLFRVYVERVDELTLSLLIVMAGTGGNDIMAVWFPDVTTDAFNDYMNRHNAR